MSEETQRGLNLVNISFQTAQEFINPVDRQIAAMFQMSPNYAESTEFEGNNFNSSNSNLDEKSFLMNSISDENKGKSSEDEERGEEFDEDDEYFNDEHEETKSCNYSNLKKRGNPLSIDTHSVDFTRRSIRIKT